MDRVATLAVLVGTALVAVGTTTAALGAYQEATTADYCTQGSATVVERLGPGESPAATGVPFADLSPEKRRVFLDALRDERNMTADTSTFHDEYVVAYRGVRYRTDEIYVLCGPPHAGLLQAAGAATALVGLVLGLPAAVRLRSERVRGLLR